MNEAKRYNSIDNFRILSSLMVIAIHSFPFSSYHKIFDNIITLTIFRIAVPFFFIVSGYFLMGPYALKQNYITEHKINKNISSLLSLYLISMIIYLPLSILNNTINMDISFLNLLKMIIFDGTFYHLWYFPAIILGLILVKYMIKHLNIKTVFFISIILYIIGLFGDSYYGFIDNAILNSSYNIIFKFSSCTRNGLFFTPIFLILGAIIFKYGDRMKNNIFNYIGFIISMGLLTFEGYYINTYSIPKHNSMYIALLPTMYFLFNILLNSGSKYNIKNANKISLIIYVIHPIIIYSVYIFGKIAFPINNSLIKYIIISILTIIISIFISKFIFKNKYTKKKSNYRTTKYISKENIINNLNEVKNILPEDTKIMAVVKSNAYGHNSSYFTKILEENNIIYFAVANIDEGIALRKSGAKGNILIFSYTPLDRIDEILYYDLIITIVDYNYAIKLNSLNKNVRAHIKIDSGMHRLGINCYDTEKLMKIYKMKNINIEGIYSHLGSSDELDYLSRSRTKKQIDRFDSLLCILKSNNINLGLTHLQSSYGLLNYPNLKYDMVRIGLLLYGVLSHKDDNTVTKLNLKPVLKLTGRISQIFEIDKDEYIGYGLDFKTKRKSKIGIISTGYADGIPREISNNNYSVSYNNQNFPIISKVCMDMIIVDITDIENINIDDEVLLIKNPEDIGKYTNTITNEILIGFGNRVVDKPV